MAASNIQSSFDQIAQLIGPGLGQSSLNAVAALQTNYYADNGWEVTTNTWGEMGFLMPGFNQYGARVALNQEEGLGSANHSMYKLTDLLALGAALEKLDRTMTFARLNELVKLGSNDMKGSYEGVLDALRKVLVDRNVPSTPTGDTDNGTGARNTYHQAIAELTQRLAEPDGALKSLVGKVTLSLADTSIATKAKTDFAAFLSLNALSPVVLNTTDTAAIAALKTTNPTLAAAWTADANGRLSGDTTKVYGYSDNWYADRAAMLADVVYRNKYDEGNSFGAVRGRGTITAGHYLDVASGIEMTVGDTLLTTQRDYLFGDDKDNTLGGHEGADHLYGGAGDDAINGDFGSDRLEGGEGNDTYLFNGAFGSDTISDTDGVGLIKVDGIQLTGGQKLRDNVWESGDGKHKVQRMTRAAVATCTASATTFVITQLSMARVTEGSCTCQK